MGWGLAAELPPPESDSSVTVALIGALGLVVVALIGLASTWLSRSARTTESPPAGADPKLGERQAVTETQVTDTRRTLSVLDRHVDKIGDAVDRQRWDHDDLRARFEEHMRRHHGDPS